VVAETFHVEGDPDYDGRDGRRRLEFFCVAGSSTVWWVRRQILSGMRRTGQTAARSELEAEHRCVTTRRSTD
jgi:hypothetical protein